MLQGRARAARGRDSGGVTRAGPINCSKVRTVFAVTGLPGIQPRRSMRRTAMFSRKNCSGKTATVVSFGQVT
jgi:hypothetical protein